MAITSSPVKRTWRWLMSSLAGLQFGGARDLYEVLGYPRELNAQDYLGAYLRGDIAARIVDAYPAATWRECPTICAMGDENGEGPFAQAVEQLNKDQKLFQVLARLDRLVNMGHYGVLFLGLGGAEQPNMPARPGVAYKLGYLKPFGEPSAQITAWGSDPIKPDFGTPTRYTLTTGVEWAGFGGGRRSVIVDASRVIHIAENALDDPSIGLPRLERGWNRLMDLDKLVGGSAEVFWQNAAQLRAWKAEADATWEPADKAAMEDQIEELQHKLRRDVLLRGVEPQSLAGQIDDPSPHIDKVLDIIAGAYGIPKRILLGTESGELASSQDENNWAGRIVERREQHAGPNIVRPLIDKLVAFGVLPQPEGGDYEIEWPESDTLGEVQRATIASQKASAVSTYVGTPGTEQVVPPEEFRVWLGLSEVSDYAPPEESFAPEPDPLDETNPEVKAAADAITANAAPRSLYVRRDVLNWRELAAWAKEQGFPTTVGEAMHVTIAYSRAPVDWMRITEAWSREPDGTLAVPAGGPRVVEQLGPAGAVVLEFNCSDLKWRHDQIREAGASWDFADYTPHITFTYEPGDVAKALESITPYAGEIVLGPEIFEPVDDATSYRDTLTEHRRRP